MTGPVGVESRRWFADRQDDRPVSLYCFPHSGGGTGWFRAWREYTPPWLEVVPVRLPGRETRLDEPGLRDARRIVAEVAPHLPADGRPLALFGHSMGGLLAYELALLLDARGRPPVQLFVSGCPAPHRRPSVRRLSDRPMAEILAYLATVGGTPAEALAESELMSLWEPALRADFAVVERYVHRPGPPLSCPVAALSGTDDPVTTEEGVEPWRELTRADFRRFRYAADHAFPLSQRHHVVRDVAAALTDRLIPAHPRGAR